MRRYVPFAAGAILMALAGRAEAHGGAEAAAFILDPSTHGVVVDDDFTFAWTDFDVDGEGGTTFQAFYFTKDRPPPWPIWSEPAFLDGDRIAAGIRLADTVNTLTWNTSTVAAGAYWVWSIADDPDIVNDATTIRFSPFPVTIAHAGDAVQPSVVLTSPADAFEIASGTYPITWSAFDPDGSSKVTLYAGTSTSGEGLDVIASDLDAAVGTFDWDTTDLPRGDYLLKVSLEDGRGFTFDAYAPFLLLVADTTPTPYDAGVTTMDAGRVEAGTTTTPVDPPAESDGCRCVAMHGTADGAALLAGLVLLLGFRRRS